MAANSAMVMLYWDIGRLILDRQEKEGWGARVIDRLSTDLREAYPDMDGLSSRNLLFMRSFAAVCPDMQIVKQLVSQLPWGHVIRLLQRIKDPDIRQWYVTASIAHGWSRNVLELQIEARKPLGVATYRIVKRLPKELKGQLPGPKEIARLLEDGE